MPTINLFLGALTDHWLLVDILVGWAVSVGAFLLMLQMLPRSLWLVLAAAIAFFSPRVSEVWVNGWNLMWPLSALFAVVVVRAFCGRLSWPRWGLAGALLLLGMVTAGRCVALIPAAGAVLALRAWHERAARWQLLAWAGVSALAMAIIMSVSTAKSGGAPIDWVIGLTRVIGHTLWSPAPEWGGAALIAAFAALVFWGHRSGLADAPTFRFSIGIGVYVLAMAWLVSMARSGEPHARYLSTTILLPIAVAAMAYQLVRPALLLAPLMAIWAASALTLGAHWWSLMQGWSPDADALVERARSEPLSLRAEHFIGQGMTKDEVELVQKGLDTMLRLRTNIYARVP